AGNGLAIQNLVRLFGLTGDSGWWERAQQALAGWSHTMERFPRACPVLFAALDSFYNHIQVTIQPADASVLLARYIPTTSVQVDDRTPGAGLVCIETKCLKPAESFEALLTQLEVNQCRQ
ncbi:MAG: thioredoxin domain-containing protein, partial [Cyanobacteria bacterium J06555_12]